jgi:coenzyme F420-reducing hydrogenase alpha subunit
MKSKTIKVDYLARVEGEGSLNIKIKNNKVVDAKLGIFEPPRFFEAFLRGRKFTEAPDITARICGICPIAYQTSSILAMENICGVKVEGQLRALRRLIYCGEWIESHVLHVYMLHAPDFLGYEDAIQIAKDYPDVVKGALRLKKIGNDIVNIIGGREIHPINMRVGGFFKAPTKKELKTLVEPLKWARDAAIETVKFMAKLQIPDFEQDYEYVAMRHPDEYPIFDGRLVSNKGLNIAINEYDKHFAEEHVEHSNALQSTRINHGNYFVGPLARYNLNFDKLSKVAQQAARSVKLDKGTNNPFKSIIVRSIETVEACEEALRIIGQYEMPEKSFIEVKPKAGIGYGCSEAPRGICVHRYRIDDDGNILDAKIVPPTSQNQKTIESDLKLVVGKNLKLSTSKLTWLCEQAVRNYDPCISCATHFLKLKIERE